MLANRQQLLDVARAIRTLDLAQSAQRPSKRPTPQRTGTSSWTRPNAFAMLWEVDIYPAPGQTRSGRLGAWPRRPPNWAWPIDLRVAAAHGYLIQGDARRTSRSRRMARELLADSVVERAVVGAVGDPRLIDSAAASSTAPQARWLASGPRAAQAGRDGPRGPKRAGGHRRSRSARPTPSARCASTGSPGVERRRSSSSLCSKVLANDAIEQVVVGPLHVRPARARLALSVSSSVTVPLRALDDDGPGAAEPRGAALSVAGRDADDPGALSRAGPRPDRRRAGNDRPDLERALQPQDAGRPDRLSRRATASGTSRTCSRRRSSPPRSEIRRDAGRRRLVRERVRGQRRHRPLRRPVQRRVQGRDAQSSLGAGALRRREHGHRRRDPRSAGHRPGRQAGLQHRRVLLRPARHAGRRRCRPACCIRGA